MQVLDSPLDEEKPIEERKGESWNVNMASVMKDLQEIAKYLKSKSSVKENTSTWIIDTSATTHMTCNLNMFDSYTKMQNSSPIYFPNGTMKKVQHLGTVKLEKKIELKDVIHIPSFKCNILSISKLAKPLMSMLTFTELLCVVRRID